MKRIRPRTTWKVLFAALTTVLLAAACGGETDGQSEPAAPETTAAPTTAAPTTAAPQTTRAPETTTTNASQITTVPESTTTTEAPGFEPTLLSYKYPSDGGIEYSMSIEQQAEVLLEGGPAEGGMPPGPIKMKTILAGAMSYTISPGPEEDTVSIRIVSDIQTVETRPPWAAYPYPPPSWVRPPASRHRST